jgi:hypothetical protein
MNKVLVKALRAITTATLIGGSVFVQHVARAEQSGREHADLQRHAGIGHEACSVHHREREAAFFSSRSPSSCGARIATANAP